MEVSYLQIKDGPLFTGTAFGFTENSVAGEIGKCAPFWCSSFSIFNFGY